MDAYHRLPQAFSFFRWRYGAVETEANGAQYSETHTIAFCSDDSAPGTSASTGKEHPQIENALASHRWIRIHGSEMTCKPPGWTAWLREEAQCLQCCRPTATLRHENPVIYPDLVNAAANEAEAGFIDPDPWSRFWPATHPLRIPPFSQLPPGSCWSNREETHPGPP